MHTSTIIHQVVTPRKEWEIYHEFSTRDHLTVLVYNESGKVMFPSNISHAPGAIFVRFMTPVFGECHIHCIPWEWIALWDAVQNIIAERNKKSS